MGIASIADEIKAKSKDDFIVLCTDESSSENPNNWIPVSERLPLLRLRYSHKISDDVLITNGFGIDMGCLVEREGKIFWHYYVHECEVGVKDKDDDVTAWMPLPEPYKVEGEK